MYKIFLLLALSSLSLFSQPVITEPWEPGEGKINLLKQETDTRRPASLLDYISLSAISYYQNSISGRSISRCPFEISCSRFAVIAIGKYGLLGYAVFIDRYFYRENPGIFSLYTRKLTKDNIIKLDDKTFLDIF